MAQINSGKEIIMILENEPAIAILKKNKSIEFYENLK